MCTTATSRRDNIHKARIKVLVKALGVERFREQVEEAGNGEPRVNLAPRSSEEAAQVDRVRAHFVTARL